MTKEQFLKTLVDSGLNENSIEFGLNCFDIGRKSEQNELAKKLQLMPLNDTANSIAIWILEQE